MSSFRRIGTVAVALAVAWSAEASAQWDKDDHAGPVYQHRAFEWSHGHGGYGRYGGYGGYADHHRDRLGGYAAPPVASGWFQRPYPYHLDYYRMRYGGSYAPYFGNLYGPPAVYAPPPYYGPYYGGYGNGYGYPMPYGETGWYGGPPPGGPSYYSPNGEPSARTDAPAELPAADLPATSE